MKNIDHFCFVALIVNDLVALKFVQDKRVHESLDLSSGPMHKERHLLEKGDPSFNLLELKLFQYLLVVFAANYSKTAVSNCLDGGSSRLIVLECELAEALSLLESNNFNEPFKFFILQKKYIVSQLLRSKAQNRLQKIIQSFLPLFGAHIKLLLLLLFLF